MKIIFTLLLLIYFFYTPEIYTQKQSILIFDPYGVSAGFQSSFSILSDDSVFIADTIDNAINNYDAFFLFLGNPYELDQEEGNYLIEYLQNQKPIYLYTELGLAQTDSVDFWKFIGLDFYAEATLTVPVDSVFGIESEFTNGVIIDTSFWSPGIPFVQGNLTSVLVGKGGSFDIDVAYISGIDSIKIIVDQYFQIHHIEFLENVLIYFGLMDPNSITDFNNSTVYDFNLSQNYPNPFNPSTKIKYQIPPHQNPLPGGDNRGGLVTLKVYDVLGNEIITLVNEEKQSGEYEVDFDPSELSSGIYYYKLQAANFTSTKKMVYLK